ncbi:HD domain-containing protein [Candidatus Woesebacteria bacterium]|nr:HD domain-containing protein [Candidatus Woesebacteria bacterium]
MSNQALLKYSESNIAKEYTNRWYNPQRLMLKHYHHFKGNDLTRSEKIQRQVTEMILESKISDENRENSKVWELKHHAGTVQIGRIVAFKRGLDPEIAEIVCLLHDIYAIVQGKYKDHAKLGAEIARKILKDSVDFK